LRPADSGESSDSTVEEIIELTQRIFKVRIVSQEGPGRPEGQVLPSEIFTVACVTEKNRSAHPRFIRATGANPCRAECHLTRRTSATSYPAFHTSCDTGRNFIPSASSAVSVSVRVTSNLPSALKPADLILGVHRING